jgi:hypothetical protein
MSISVETSRAIEKGDRVEVENSGTVALWNLVLTVERIGYRQHHRCANDSIP